MFTLSGEMGKRALRNGRERREKEKKNGYISLLLMVEDSCRDLQSGIRK